MEEKYNFKIEMCETTVTTDNARIVRDAKKLIASQEDFCDVMIGHTKTMAQTALEGSLVDLSQQENLNLTKAYWDQDFLEAMSMGGHTFMMSGDILICDDDSLFVTTFNSELAADYGLKTLYDTARSGKWTFDVMKESIKMVSSDLDNNGAYDQNDVIGMLYTGNSVMQQILSATDTSVVGRDTDGLLVLNDRTRLFDVYELAEQLLHTEGYTLNWLNFDTEQIPTITSMFENKRVLFQMGALSMIRRYYRDIVTNFGVLPLPKYDESQASYSTMCNVTTMEVLAIPVTSPLDPRTGIALEVLAAESDTLTQSYYEVCFQSKYTRDEESYEMLKLAQEKIVYDPCTYYDFGGMMTALNNAVKEGAPIASLYESYVSASQTALDEFNQFE